MPQPHWVIVQGDDTAIQWPQWNPPPDSFWDSQSLSLAKLRGWQVDTQRKKLREGGYGGRFPPDDPIFSSGIWFNGKRWMNPCMESILPWEVTSIVGTHVVHL